MNARMLTAAAMAAVALAACQPTTQELDPLRATFTPYCDRAQGLDIEVANTGDAPVPVTVTFGDATYNPDDYATPTRRVAPGDDTVYSFPGSRPDAVTVRIGDASGVGWITEDFNWVTGCVR